MESMSPLASANEPGSLRGRAVQPVTPSRAQSDADERPAPNRTRQSADVANYVKLRANIANAVADVQNRRSAAATGEQALMALMPQPVAMLPLPPTDRDMVEFVAQVVQSVAQQAAQAQAAQAANISSTLVASVSH
jgi:hypothetical protein